RSTGWHLRAAAVPRARRPSPALAPGFPAGEAGREEKPVLQAADAASLIRGPRIPIGRRSRGYHEAARRTEVETTGRHLDSLAPPSRPRSLAAANKHAAEPPRKTQKCDRDTWRQRQPDR